jgi:hypothetical protein
MTSSSHAIISFDPRRNLDGYLLVPRGLRRGLASATTWGERGESRLVV